jgi:NaMN:DMB phosphoribosyltransferase
VGIVMSPMGAFHRRVVEEAVRPGVSWLRRRDQRVTQLAVVGSCVPAGGRVAAANVTAAETQAQVHPWRSRPQALGTPS